MRETTQPPFVVRVPSWKWNWVIPKTFTFPPLLGGRLDPLCGWPTMDVRVNQLSHSLLLTACCWKKQGYSLPCEIVPLMGQVLLWVFHRIPSHFEQQKLIPSQENSQVLLYSRLVLVFQKSYSTWDLFKIPYINGQKNSYLHLSWWRHRFLKLPHLTLGLGSSPHGHEAGEPPVGLFGAPRNFTPPKILVYRGCNPSYPVIKAFIGSYNPM